MFCFTFVSDHNTDFLMLYSVQLENMYSYLNSSLKLSDIERGLFCQQPYEPVHEISNNVVCATSKASDQTAHTHSLIRAFASRLSIL